MSSTRRNLPENPRIDGDFYRTPPAAVVALYDAVPELPAPTLDPCAGDGALLEGRVRCGKDALGSLFGIELHAGRAAEAARRGLPVVQGDGLLATWCGEHVLQNPPFSRAADFVEKAVVEAETACILLPLNFKGSQERCLWWRAIAPWLRSEVVLSTRPKFRTGPGSDSSDYAWFVFSQDSLPIDRYYFIRMTAEPGKVERPGRPRARPAGLAARPRS